MNTPREGHTKVNSVTWDAVVVGAGPAGSAAAEQLARAGARVLLLERRRRVGVPVLCAEHVPLALRRKVAIPRQCVAQQVRGTITYVEGREEARTQSPGLILRRERFDEHMARLAVGAGAELRTCARVIAVRQGEVLYIQEGEILRELTRVIIGADGPLSRVGRSVGLCHSRFVHAAQVEVPIEAPMEWCEVHFRRQWTGGYGWVFPKGKTANVGIGALPSKGLSLPRALQSFLLELRERGRIASCLPLRRSGGLIPVGGALESTVRDNILLSGDAAGHTHPVTGAGISSAVACGRMAGQHAAEALEAADMGRLARYEQRWRDELGSHLERATRRRREMEELWGRMPLHRVVSRCWVAFPEYYR